MVQNEQQLQSLGICHRLFRFIMRNLAAQALKPVTLGPPAQIQQTRMISWPVIDRQEMNSQRGYSINGAEDCDILASVEIEDESSRLLDASDQGKITIEFVGKAKTKAPRKMVSIKDEPEIINESKKRKKNEVTERRNDGELRPLRSILKVGSNFPKTSAQDGNGNPVRKATLD
uniref:Uncharacterized protein n=1 Tax=Chenopodium quinoa TaxID=63459 RepID=A0A803KPA4_CHEQI